MIQIRMLTLFHFPIDKSLRSSYILYGEQNGEHSQGKIEGKKGEGSEATGGSSSAVEMLRNILNNMPIFG